MNQAPALTPPAGAQRRPQSAECGLKPQYMRRGVRGETRMSIVALFAWMITIFAGLILLMIWIIEYDREFQKTAATRLPVPVISVHALLGLGGLTLWIGYLLVDEERLAWAAFAILGTVAALGLIMAARWIGVYRAFAAPGPSLTRRPTVPPERNFPLPVVVAHGILAITTLVLVLFTALAGT